MKIASWNVNSLRVRLQHVLDWLADQQPDVLGLQETKTEDAKFPREELEAAGYHVTFAGQKTYNGVAMLSREAATDTFTDVPGLDDPQRRILGVTTGGVRILDLYVPNGSQVGSEKYEYKLDWLEKVTRHIETELAAHPGMVVMGDFNIAPDDRDVHDPEAWHEKILCSTPERGALKTILELGFSDSFRLFEQEAEAFSWWDYRAGGFRRNHGMRIDLLLVSDALAGRCRSSSIDLAPRKLERPSDHTPVVIELDL